MHQHKINRYFVRYRIDGDGTYVSVLSITNVHKMSDHELLKTVLKTLIAEIWAKHQISVEEGVIDILSLSLLDAITHIELI